MLVVEVADRLDPRDAVGVAELASERIARVRRIGDHAPRAHDVSDRGDRSLLRIGRMNVEVPRHATSLRSLPSSAQVLGDMRISAVCPLADHPRVISPHSRQDPCSRQRSWQKSVRMARFYAIKKKASKIFCELG